MYLGEEFLRGQVQHLFPLTAWVAKPLAYTGQRMTTGTTAAYGNGH